jgi:hypothetical protein
VGARDDVVGVSDVDKLHEERGVFAIYGILKPLT